jgi:hypothetical protein
VKAFNVADPPAGGRVPDALLQSQKRRFGGVNGSNPHWDMFVVNCSSSESAWIRLFLLTSPNLFLIDPLSPIELYKRAAITKIDVVLIWYSVLIYLLFLSRNPL